MNTLLPRHAALDAAGRMGLAPPLRTGNMAAAQGRPSAERKSVVRRVSSVRSI